MNLTPQQKGVVVTGAGPPEPTGVRVDLPISRPTEM